MQLLTRKKLALLFTLALLASPARAEERFHAPRTVAEKALHEILWRSDYDRGFLDYVFLDANRNPTRDAGYAKNVTKGFRTFMAAYEKALPKNTCDGKFRSGRVCGYDANPLTCRQDVGEYLYITQKKSKTALTIAVVAKDQIIQDQKTLYTLVMENDAWKVDGVHCHDGPSFNFKEK